MEPLESDLEDTLREVLALPSRIRLQWKFLGRTRDFGIGRFSLTIGTGSQTVRFLLEDRRDADKAWLRSERVALSYDQVEVDLMGVDWSRRLILGVGLRFKRSQSRNGGRALTRLEDLVDDLPFPEEATDDESSDNDHHFESVSRHLARRPGEDIYHHSDGALESRIGMLRLGFLCNQDCHFCWQGRDWPDPPTDSDPAHMIDQLALSGTKNLVITGGEPTINPRLPEFIDRAYRVHGMSVTLQTNAIRLKKESYTRQLAEAGLGTLFVSFHSADKSISDTMTRAPGTWTKTVQGIRNGLMNGFRVHLNCVVERANVEGLAEHARFIIDEFVSPFAHNPVFSVEYSQPSIYHDRSHWETALTPIDEVRVPLKTAVTNLKSAGVKVEYMGTCGFPTCTLPDETDGIRAQAPADFAEISVGGRSYAAVCDACAIKSKCLGVRAQYLQKWNSRGLEPFRRLPFDS